jgi:large subunit ribosomal protein L13
MKIIDGNNTVLGRLASFCAKEALKGEEIRVVNCENVIINGNQKTIKREFKEKRSRFGHSQKGPKHHADCEKIVKRAIRGMLPNHREGRGKTAFSQVKCYKGLPKEFENTNLLKLNDKKKIKYSKIMEFAKK